MGTKHQKFVSINEAITEIENTLTPEIAETIRVHHENDWTRFNFHKKGISQGFTIDIMNLLGKREGFHAP